MVKVKKSVGFRTKKKEEKEEHFEEWDIYPTHVVIEDDYWDVYPTHIYIPSDYWTVSTTVDKFNKKRKKTKKK